MSINARGVPIGVPPGECSATLRSVGGVLGTIERILGRPSLSFAGVASVLPSSGIWEVFKAALRKLPPAARIAAIKSHFPSISAGVFETAGTASEVGVLDTAGADPLG
jgi:hypothetical protein